MCEKLLLISRAAQIGEEVAPLAWCCYCSDMLSGFACLKESDQLCNIDTACFTKAESGQRLSSEVFCVFLARAMAASWWYSKDVGHYQCVKRPVVVSLCRKQSPVRLELHGFQCACSVITTCRTLTKICLHFGSHRLTAPPQRLL